MKLLLQNTTLTDGTKTDILIVNGLIERIGTDLTGADEVINACNLVAIPGLVDMHVHLRDPGFEHKEDVASGSAAAAAGGVTTVCCMPNTSPVADSGEVLRYIIDKADAVGLCRVLPIAAITNGQRGESLCDLAALAAAGACGFSDDGLPVMNRGLMSNALVAAAALGRPVISHCEDFDFVAPTTAKAYGFDCDLAVSNDEEAMVAREIALSLETGAPIHIAHVSTAGSVALIRAAKQAGARVTCETCPHYMLLTSEALQHKGSNAKMNPPLRSADDVAAIIDGLCDGTIDIIVTDHAPHSSDEKASAHPPNGIVGLETLLAGAITALKDRMALVDIVAKMTTETRRILGIGGGEIAVGRPADIALVDPDEEWICAAKILHSKSKNTPFDGFRFTGSVKCTLLGGKVVYRA